jgi:hypothetical protein
LSTIHRRMAATAAAVVLGLVPAVALAHGPGGGNSQNAPGHTRTAGSGTPTNSTANSKAYGRLCQAESKKHVAGQSGTPFSTCVKDMAQAANSSHPNPHRVCANESKKHVAGMKGTPYSQCVVAAAKLRGKGSGSGTETTTTSTTTTSSTNTTTSSTNTTTSSTTTSTTSS